MIKPLKKRSVYPPLQILLLAAVVLLLLSSLSSCMSRQLASDNIQRIEAVLVKLDLAEDFNSSVVEMNNGLKTGSSGFYYVIDSEGTILHHPVKDILGMNMKDQIPINYIIAASHDIGYIVYEAVGSERIVMFKRNRSKNRIIVFCCRKAEFYRKEIGQ